MSLDSKYNRMKEFNKPVIKFKVLKPKNPKTQLKKEPIMKNVAELDEKYYNAYENDCDNDDELKRKVRLKRKKIDYKQFELFDKTDEGPKLDKKIFYRDWKSRKSGW